MEKDNYKKLNWGTFLIENSFGKEVKYYSKGFLIQTYGLTKNEISQYLSLNLKVFKITEQDIEKEFHLIKAKDCDAYLEFRNKHKDEFKKI